MLSWITGSRPDAEARRDSHEPTDPVEPETPGPVFAFRAFKYALMGTPRPSAAHSGSHNHHPPPASSSFFSHGSPNKGKNHHSRTQSADMALQNRPSSAPSSSENKTPGPPQPHGILLTPRPGTTQRRKTVSFGSQVEDNEGKTEATLRGSIGGGYNGGKSPSSATPIRTPKGTVPGGFPISPFIGATPVSAKPQVSRTPTPGKPRSKLTESLYSVREGDSNTKLETSPERRPRGGNSSSTNGTDVNHTRPFTSTGLRKSQTETSPDPYDSDSTVDFDQPKSQSGQFWKQHFESYSERSERELRGVLLELRMAKQQAESREIELSSIQSTLMIERSEAKAREGELTRRVELYKSRLDETLDEVKRLRAELQAATATAATAPTANITSHPAASSPPRRRFIENGETKENEFKSTSSSDALSRPPSSFTPAGVRYSRAERFPKSVLDSPPAPRESKPLSSERTLGLSSRARTSSSTLASTESHQMGVSHGGGAKLTSESVPSLPLPRPLQSQPSTYSNNHTTARPNHALLSSEDGPASQPSSFPSVPKANATVNATSDRTSKPASSSGTAVGQRKVWRNRADEVRSQLQEMRSLKNQARGVKVDAE